MARHLEALGMAVVLDDAASMARGSAGAAAIWTARGGDIVAWRGPAEALMDMAANYAGRTVPGAGAPAGECQAAAPEVAEPGGA